MVKKNNKNISYVPVFDVLFHGISCTEDKAMHGLHPAPVQGKLCYNAQKCNKES
jgi:hypothetical protein